MSDPLGRRKDNIWTGMPNKWEYVPICILQDIRDELKRLNGILGCHNVTRGFRALERISRQTERTFKRRVDSAVRKRLARKGKR